MKRCRICGKEKAVKDFCYRDKANNKRHTACRDCTRLQIRAHYKRNIEYYVQKALRRNRSNRDKCRKKIAEYLNSHPCVDCGEADPVVLEFDHVDRSTKTAAVSVMVQRFLSWRVILQEIGKCEVRCANCHRRRTARQLGYYSHAVPEIKEILPTRSRRAAT